MAFITFQPSDYFNTKLYTGTGAENVISDVGFNPDWVWFKKRSATEHHFVYDKVRGALKKLAPSNSNAEATETQTLKSFGTGGYTLGTSAEVNGSSTTYAAWNWLANGSGSSNSDGSITSTVSANTTSGFSIVKYTGTLANATVGHGLGVAPKMIFFKNMSASGNWNVYHGDIGKDKRLYLNTTAAQETATNYMNDTAPTSSVFSVGVATDTNGNGNDQIAYCFAEVKGFSQFGTYSGSNTTDGPFIYTGFRPAFYLWKKYEAVDSWNLVDSKRIGYNINNNRLFPNANTAEDTQDRVDLVANGIKIRTNDSGTNGSGVAYMYMAFAEFPFVGSNETPGVAR